MHGHASAHTANRWHGLDSYSECIHAHMHTQYPQTHCQQVTWLGQLFRVHTCTHSIHTHTHTANRWHGLDSYMHRHPHTLVTGVMAWTVILRAYMHTQASTHTTDRWHSMDSYSQCIHTHVTPGKVCILVVTHTHTLIVEQQQPQTYIYMQAIIYIMYAGS